MQMSQNQNLNRTIVMIPTYNEAGNIKRLISDIRNLNVPGHDLRILVVDDNSPDGTGRMVTEIAARDSHVELHTRFNKRGRGTAGIDGFKEALKRGADYVIEMDADFSHDPKYIPSLIAAADAGADLVLGSRFITGGADEDRGIGRRLLTKSARLYISTVLGLPYKDLTGGYRCYKKKVLESIDLDGLTAVGPSVVLETLYKTVAKGFKVAEVPIIFIDRREGVSKLDSSKLAECLYMVAKMRGLQMTGRLFRNG